MSTRCGMALMAAGAGLACIGMLLVTDASASSADSIDVRLEATPYNAGRVARASLVPVGNKTEVVIDVGGVPNYVAWPVHLDSYLYAGTCENRTGATHLNQPVAHPEAMTHHPRNTPVRYRHIVNIPIEKLRASPHALGISLTARDGNQEIFCGRLF